MPMLRWRHSWIQFRTRSVRFVDPLHCILERYQYQTGGYLIVANVFITKIPKYQFIGETVGDMSWPNGRRFSGKNRVHAQIQYFVLETNSWTNTQNFNDQEVFICSVENRVHNGSYCSTFLFRVDRFGQALLPLLNACFSNLVIKKSRVICRKRTENFLVYKFFLVFFSFSCFSISFFMQVHESV